MTQQENKKLAKKACSALFPSTSTCLTSQIQLVVKSNATHSTGICVNEVSPPTCKAISTTKSAVVMKFYTLKKNNLNSIEVSG